MTKAMMYVVKGCQQNIKSQSTHPVTHSLSLSLSPTPSPTPRCVKGVAEGQARAVALMCPSLVHLAATFPAADTNTKSDTNTSTTKDKDQDQDQDQDKGAPHHAPEHGPTSEGVDVDGRRRGDWLEEETSNQSTVTATATAKAKARARAETAKALKDHPLRGLMAEGGKRGIGPAWLATMRTFLQAENPDTVLP